MAFPNVPTPTLGGNFFWQTLRAKNGWKLQQNDFTKLYRILDPANIRRDWDSNLNTIECAFDTFTQSA